MKNLLYWKGSTVETEQNTKLPQSFTIADLPKRLLQAKQKSPPASLLMSARNCHNLDKGLPETIGVNAFNLKCSFNYQPVPFSKAVFYLKVYVVLLLWQLDHLLAMHIKNSDSKYVMFPGRFLMESEMLHLAKLWSNYISFGRLMTPKNYESDKERIGGNITYEQLTVAMLFLCLFGSIIC